MALYTWPASEPPHELRALLHRLANPPLSPAEQIAADAWARACAKYALVEVEQLPDRKGRSRIAA